MVAVDHELDAVKTPQTGQIATLVGVDIHVIDALDRHVDSLAGAVPGHKGAIGQVSRIDARAIGDVQRRKFVVVEGRAGKHIFPVFKGAVAQVGQIGGRQLVHRIDRGTDVGTDRGTQGDDQTRSQHND